METQRKKGNTMKELDTIPSLRKGGRVMCASPPRGHRNASSAGVGGGAFMFCSVIKRQKMSKKNDLRWTSQGTEKPDAQPQPANKHSIT